MLDIGDTENGGVDNQSLVQLETLAMRESPPLTLPGVLGPRGRTALRPRIETNTSGNTINEMLLNDILLYS